MKRSMEKPVSGSQRGIEEIRGREDARVVVGVVSRDAQPARHLGFERGLRAVRAGPVGVEVAAAESRAIARRAPESEAHDVAKVVVKVSGREMEAIGGEELLNSGIDGGALLRFQKGTAVDRQDVGLFDAFAVRRAQAR